MMPRFVIFAATAGVLLSGCAQKEVAAEAPPPPAPVVVAAPAPPPLPPGAVLGSVAADRDGDGVIDGYYTSDGIYHPNYATSAPARSLARAGERG